MSIDKVGWLGVGYIFLVVVGNVLWQAKFNKKNETKFFGKGGFSQEKTHALISS